jgi:hypothetical protein
LFTELLLFVISPGLGFGRVFRCVRQPDSHDLRRLPEGQSRGEIHSKTRCRSLGTVQSDFGSLSKVVCKRWIAQVEVIKSEPEAGWLGHAFRVHAFCYPDPC